MSNSGKKSTNLPIILQKEECKFATACEFHFSCFFKSKLKFNFWKLKSTAEVFDPVNFTLDLKKTKLKFNFWKLKSTAEVFDPVNFTFDCCFKSKL